MEEALHFPGERSLSSCSRRHRWRRREIYRANFNRTPLPHKNGGWETASRCRHCSSSHRLLDWDITRCVIARSKRFNFYALCGFTRCAHLECDFSTSSSGWKRIKGEPRRKPFIRTVLVNCFVRHIFICLLNAARGNDGNSGIYLGVVALRYFSAVRCLMYWFTTINKKFILYYVYDFTVVLQQEIRVLRINSEYKSNIWFLTEFLLKKSILSFETLILNLKWLDTDRSNDCEYN